MSRPQIEYSVGQVIHHKLFDYRGVVVGVDPVFKLSDEWYEHVARSRPPRDQPWYHVLVHDTHQVTYVAQRNLELDDSGEPIEHPLLDRHFDRFENGCYFDSRSVN